MKTAQCHVCGVGTQFSRQDTAHAGRGRGLEGASGSTACTVQCEDQCSVDLHMYMGIHSQWPVGALGH